MQGKVKVTMTEFMVLIKMYNINKKVFLQYQMTSQVYSGAHKFLNNAFVDNVTYRMEPIWEGV